MPLSKDVILKRKTEFKPCECGCGETIPIINANGIPARFKHGHNSKIQAPNWKGGRSIDNHGYVTIWKPEHPRAQANGRVYEHILVWEEDNNACLLRSGIVHHKDHNRNNNHPSNLQAMMRSKHVGIQR